MHEELYEALKQRVSGEVRFDRMSRLMYSTDAGNLLSGTIYTIGPNGNGSARAITLSGASGRVKQYIIRDNAWADRSSQTP